MLSTNIYLFFYSKGIILNYHRVVELELDPWALAVSPENFSEQLAVLRRNFFPVRLSDLNQSEKISNWSAPWVAVTFDDGYADNFHIAKTILQKYEMPATFFLLGGYLESHKRFWWDELTEFLLGPGQLPEFCDAYKNWNISENEWRAAAIYTSEEYEKYRRWCYDEDPPTPRHHLFLKLYGILRNQPEPKRDQVLNSLRIYSKNNSFGSLNDLPLTLQEAQALASDDLFDIGAHSMSHQDFKMLRSQQQKQEIAQAKVFLESHINNPIDSFAYPYGSYTKSSAKLVKKAGFSIACTTNIGVVKNKANRYLLPRIPIKNMRTNQFEDYISRILETN